MGENTWITFPYCFMTNKEAVSVLILGSFTHHYRPQHGYKAANSLSVFYKSLPEGLLLRFFQQNVFVAYILHGTVQLGLDITTTFKKKNKEEHVKEFTQDYTVNLSQSPTTYAEGIEKVFFNMHEKAHKHDHRLHCDGGSLGVTACGSACLFNLHGQILRQSSKTSS